MDNKQDAESIMTDSAAQISELTVLPDLHIVGGTVRDRVMDRPSNDIDVATSATPDEMRDIANDNDLRFFATGEDHGTLTFLLDDGTPIEATTFRKDVSTDGRRATVAWADTIEEDLARRDFTINAMAQNVETGEIVDPFGGMKDIDRMQIRAVGNPDARMQEDLLRVVRAARFASRFHFYIDDSLMDAMQAHGPSVTDVVSIERLVSETNKAFKQVHNPSDFFALLQTVSVLESFMPNVHAMIGLQQNPEHHPEGDVFQHTMDVIDRAEPRVNDSGWAVGRWCALFHDVGKINTAEKVDGKPYNTFHSHDVVGADMISGIGDRLHLPNDLVQVMQDVTRHHMYPLHAQHFDVEMKHVRRFQSKVQHIDELRALCIADAGGRRPDAIEVLFQDLPDPVEPVLMGRHLIDAGHTPGPQFGTGLDAAFEHQLDAGTTDIDALLSVAEDAMSDNQ